jgi:hypothetical protein
METSKSKACVRRWFAGEGFEGLLRDKTRASRIPKLNPAVAKRVATLTMYRRLPKPRIERAQRWRRPASVSSVQRMWRCNGLRPHRIRDAKRFGGYLCAYPSK